MRPYLEMSEAILIDSLTDYYKRYSLFMKDGGDRDEFQACCQTIIHLLDELNLRKGNNSEWYFHGRMESEESSNSPLPA